MGEENFFLFGLKTEKVYALRSRGYNPADYYNSNPNMREVIESLASGRFSRGDGNLFRPLVDSILRNDPYMLCADYQSYMECQITWPLFITIGIVGRGCRF